MSTKYIATMYVYLSNMSSNQVRMQTKYTNQVQMLSKYIYKFCTSTEDVQKPNSNQIQNMYQICMKNKSVILKFVLSSQDVRWCMTITQLWTHMCPIMLWISLTLDTWLSSLDTHMSNQSCNITKLVISQRWN